MKRSLPALLVIFSWLNAGAQSCIPDPPFSSSSCGAFNAITQVISVTPICYQGCITIQFSTGIIADSIHLKTGDGHEQTIFPTSTVDTINYCYNLTPPDSCPLSNPLSLTIEAEYFKCCSGGNFSYQYTSTTVSVKFLPKILVTTQADTICNGTNVDLTPSGCHNGFIGHPANITYDYNDGSLPIVFSNVTTQGYPPFPPYAFPTTGTYLPTVTVSNTCGTRTDTIRITVSEITGVQLSAGTACTGIPITATVNAVNGGSYNVSVSPPTVQIADTFTATPQFTFLQVGTYTLHFTIGSPPICPVDCVITVAPGPSMTIQPQPDMCFTGSDTYDFSAHFSSGNPSQTNNFSLILLPSTQIFQLQTSGTVPTVPVPLAAAGTYVVIDSSTTLCPGAVVVSDTFFLLLPVNLPVFPPDTVCAGTTLALPAIPSGVVVTLNGDTITSPNFTFTDPGASYDFIYTPLCGNTSVYSVFVRSGVNILLNSYTVCVTSSNIPLSAVPSGGSFSGNFVTGTTFNVAAAGAGTHLFYYEFTDTAGCTHLDSSTVLVNAQTSPVYVAPEVVCSGTSFVIAVQQVSDITIDGSTYTDDTVTVTITSPGIYPYSIQVAGNCSATALDTVVVNQAPPPALLLATWSQPCDGSSVSLANASGASGSIVTYTFPDGTTTTQDPPPLYLCTLPSGADSAVFSFAITLSAQGCALTTDTQSVTIYSPPVATFAVSADTVCPTDTLQLFYNVTGAAPDSVNWLINGSVVSNQPVLPPMTLDAFDADSTYTIELRIYSRCGDTSVTKYVLVHPDVFSPVIHLSNTTVCRGDEILVSGNADPQWNYAWDDGNGHQYIGSNLFPVSYDAAGSYTITVNVNSGCSVRQASAGITVNPKPVADFTTNNQSLCTGTSVQFQNLTTDGGGNNWYFMDGSLPDTLNANPSHVFVQSGNYDVMLVAENIFGCSDTVIHPVQVHPTPTAEVSLVETTLCSPASIDLAELNITNAGGQLNYVWNDSITGNPVVTVSDTGTFVFTLTASDSFCSSQAEVVVTIHPSPFADFSFLQDQANDLSLLVAFADLSDPNPAEDADYLWDFGDGSGTSEINPSHEYPAAAAEYLVTLTVENMFHCISSVQKSLSLEAASAVYVPNAFTPDNLDGKNNTFRPYLVNISEVEVNIFNRWGENVCRWTSLEGSWDGRYKGKRSQSDVYVYQIKYKDIHDIPGEVTGTVTLVQ